jgi:WD40 repeat protein
LTGSGDRTVKVWDAASGRELLTLKAPLAVYTAAFSPDGDRLVAGGADNVAHVWFTK